MILVAFANLDQKWHLQIDLFFQIKTRLETLRDAAKRIYKETSTRS